MRRTALALTVLMVLGCSSVAQAAPSRSCDTRAEGSGPHRRLAGPGDVQIGPVAFYGLARLADPQEFTRTGAVNGRHLFKTPAKVRAGKVVTVSIGAAHRGVAGLTFAPRSPRGGVPAVRFAACDRDEPAFAYDGEVGPVTAFPGGFSLAEPACVQITVRQRGRARPYSRLVPFGTSGCGRI